MATNVTNPMRRDLRSGFTTCTWCGNTFTSLGIGRHWRFCPSRPPDADKNGLPLAYLARIINRESKRGVSYIPVELAQDMKPSAIDDLCYRLRSTNSSPVLVCVGDNIGVPLTSFAGVVYQVDAKWCKVRVNRFDPTPLELDVVLEEDAFCNLFGIRR